MQIYWRSCSVFHIDIGCFLKGKRKEEEFTRCIKFTGVIMTFLSLPYKRACFLVMWQKSAQVIYNTVVWIRALIWIENIKQLPMNMSSKAGKHELLSVKLCGNKCIFIIIHLMITNIQHILHFLSYLIAAFCLYRVVVCVCVQRRLMFMTRWTSTLTYKHQEHRTSNMKTSNWLSCQISLLKRNFPVCVQLIFRCCPNYIFKNGHWTSLYHKAEIYFSALWENE